MVTDQLPPFTLLALIRGKQMPSAGYRGIHSVNCWPFSDSTALVTLSAVGWTEKKRKLPEGAAKGVLSKK